MEARALTVHAAGVPDRRGAQPEDHDEQPRKADIHGLQLTFRTSALDYPRISFGAKLRGAVRYRRSSARWLDAVTERQLP